MQDCGFIGERDCKKIHMNVTARYFAGNILSLGNITETSSKCMCISTKYMLPVNSNIQLIIPLKKNIMVLPVKVIRYLGGDSLCQIMNVEISHPSREFIEFVTSLETRTDKRFTLALEVELITKETNCTAFTKNVSQNGLNIKLHPLNTSLDLTTEAKFEIKFTIPSGEEKVSLFSEKRWASESLPRGLTEYVGLEIIDPPKKYKEFLNTLK